MDLGDKNMLKDCLEIFSNIYVKKRDKYIIDSYILSEGSYVLIDKKGIVKEIFEVGKKNIDKTYEYYNYFAERDYFSKLVDMQKPIDQKKIIHSNNYFSFFVKKENINTKLTDEIIDTYYRILSNPLQKYKKEKKDMYLEIENKYGKPNSEVIENHKKWIKENLSSILDNVKKDKSYLKIFFEADVEEYKRESEKYIIPNIYNSNDYNVKIDNIVFGLPNDNMVLNSKKPYLENKSRRNSTPYLISTEEVVIQKKFFDFLMNNASEGKNNVYLKDDYIKCIPNNETLEEDFNGYFLRVKKGKEVEIHDFDVVTGLKFKLKNLKIDKVIPIDYTKGKKVLEYDYIENIKELREVINEVYFNKFLTTSYFTEAKDIRLNDFRVKENLLRSRNAFFAWFYKGDSNVVSQVFDKVSIDLIKNSICNEYMIKAKEQFNLRCGILEYFGGIEKMEDILSDLANGLREKINSNQTGKIDSNEEYYFATGQVISYLISLNKSSKKMHSLINPILNCKTDEKLKTEVNRLFKKYNYSIRKENRRFNNLMSMILGYKSGEKIKEDILVAGYLYSSLIYESNKGEEN